MKDMNKMQKILLRKATLADVTSVVNIYIDSREKFIFFAPLVHSRESIIQWIREVLIPTSQVIVAEENDSIVGMMVLSKKDNIGWIEQLYLAPEAIGRGIGALLITEAKSKLGSPIRLHTFQENINAK